MPLEGTVVNGVIVLDDGAHLPEGARVQRRLSGGRPKKGNQKGEPKRTQKGDASHIIRI